MGSAQKFWSKTHFCLVNSASCHEVFYRKMFLLGVSFWVSVLSLFRFIHGVFVSFRIRSSSSSEVVAPPVESNQLDAELIGPDDEIEESNGDMIEFQEKEEDDERVSPKFIFKFEYQTETFKQLSNSVKESDPSSVANKDETSPLKDLHGFFRKPEDGSCRLEESSPDSVNGSSESSEALKNEVSADEEVVQENNVLEKPGDNAVGKTEDSELLDDETGEAESLSDHHTVSEKVQFLSEKDFLITDSDLGSEHDDDHFNRYFSSEKDGFLSDSDFEEFFDDSQTREVSSTASSEMLSEGDSSRRSPNEEKVRKNSEQSLELDPEDDDDANGLESLWEHQDLIEQIKMELKKVRAVGLPTILEESECPKVIEDLKPLKMENSKLHHHKDLIGELHKFYGSYRQRMRRLDILNYQKMYALGLLRSKDPLEAISTHKPSKSPAPIASILPENLRAWLPKKSTTDPMDSFITELYGDLEMVYVGQLCLSWEILHWQYRKAIELWESDQYNIRRYNEVAGEFQLFQVLTQRFLEHEPFEGPRVQSYVKKRWRLRNLLQVPLIREDRNKEKKAVHGRSGEDGAITSDKLVEIMEESIRILWRFIRADKYSNSTIQKRRSGSRVEPDEREDLEMLAEVRSTLQKKEKKLKDALRCESCILRRLQKQEEAEGSGPELYFFSQVDMRLVGRVLNMSKITSEHLAWCHEKLSRISCVDRKRIHVEPSFLLFPC